MIQVDQSPSMVSNTSSRNLVTLQMDSMSQVATQNLLEHCPSSIRKNSYKRAGRGIRQHSKTLATSILHTLARLRVVLSTSSTMVVTGELLHRSMDTTSLLQLTTSSWSTLTANVGILMSMINWHTPMMACYQRPLWQWLTVSPPKNQKVKSKLLDSC